MLTQHYPPPGRPNALRLLLTLALLALLTACTSTQVRTARDDGGQRIGIRGTVVLVEPDIELYEVLAGGAQEPREAWTDTARRIYPQAARDVLQQQGIPLSADFRFAPEMGVDDPLRQLYLLNQAVSLSIVQYSTRSGTGPLRNKHGRFDWTLGPGVSALRDATGADYALFTYIRDSYTSGGRAAMRVVGFLLLGGDIGGGMQVGLASLVDLRTGQVVWHNLLVAQTGDLRDETGARETAGDLLKGMKR